MSEAEQQKPEDNDNDNQSQNAPSLDKTEIHVDEDWKAQVEREKAELQQPDQAAEAGADAAPDLGNAESPKMEIPPASFAVLISTLATQAMASLGIFPDPMTGQPNTDRTLAKHFIDTLAVLEEKTKNNLSDDEATQLRDSLHQLRMIYLQMPPTPAKTDLANAEDTPKKPIIELP
jgi:hypothetical protein